MNTPNPINITHIDHFVLRARDINVLIDFYCNVLGCRIERAPGSFGIAQLRAGKALIDIADANSAFGKQGGALPDGVAPNVDHICLFVSPWDEQAIVNTLSKYHVEFGEVNNRYGASGVGPSIYLKDPEGNTLELKGSAL